jgi:DNA-binding CsgD family transcriptional regulator
VGFVLFYYTLFVMLASILASATCLSAYLVSHKREMLFAMIGFLFYFFDVAWVLQDDFALLGDLQVVGVFAIVRSLVSVVTGGGCLMAFWLLICDYLGGTSRALRWVPGIVYVVGSIAALELLPAGDVQRFVFYTTRAMLLFWMLIYCGFRYFTSKEEVERNRLRRHRWLYVAVWALGLLMVAEDASFFLIFDPQHILMWPRSYAPERNFMENILMLSLSFFACRDAFQVLSMRFERPPMHGGEVQDARITENLMVYGKRHQLSEREQEVLHLVLMGNDNQNIASTMHLALSTVKVHVHNILQKTGQPNRQALTQDFWKTS